MHIKLGLFAFLALLSGIFSGAALAQTSEDLIPASSFSEKGIPSHCRFIKIIKNPYWGMQINTPRKNICHLLTKSLYRSSSNVNASIDDAAIRIGEKNTLLLAANVRIRGEGSTGVLMDADSQLIGLPDGAQRPALEELDVAIKVQAWKEAGFPGADEAEILVGHLDIEYPITAGILFAGERDRDQIINVAIEDVAIQGVGDNAQALHKAGTAGVQMYDDWNGTIHLKQVYTTGLGVGFALGAKDFSDKHSTAAEHFELKLDAVRAVANLQGAEFNIPRGRGLPKAFPPVRVREEILAIGENSIFDNNYEDGVLIRVDGADIESVFLKDMTAINNAKDGILFEYADSIADIDELPIFAGTREWHVVASDNGEYDINNQTREVIEAAYAPNTFGKVETEMPPKG